MMASNDTIRCWLERLADVIERRPRRADEEPLIVAYARAAEAAAIDSGLVDRLWAMAGRADPLDLSAAAELRSIAAAIRLRH